MEKERDAESTCDVEGCVRAGLVVDSVSAEKRWASDGVAGCAVLEMVVVGGRRWTVVKALKMWSVCFKDGVE